MALYCAVFHKMVFVYTGRFSFLLAGISLLLLIVQKKLFDGSGELRIFYTFFTLVWLSRIIIQLIWPWPSRLQLWLVVAFSAELLFVLIPMIYLLGNAPKQECDKPTIP